jgi:hypothetical protein
MPLHMPMAPSGDVANGTLPDSGAAAEDGPVSAAHVVGWLLVVGAIAFGMGAGDPWLVRAWTAPRESFLAIVAQHPRAWRATHILFIAGTVATAAGLAVLPGLLPEAGPRSLALAGAAAFGIAAVLWIIDIVYRLAVTPDTARDFESGGSVAAWVDVLERLHGGLFVAFIVIALAGLAAVGLAVTAGGPIPPLLGWGAAALSGILIVGLVVTGDMPPFTVYVAPLAFGAALLVGA